MALCIMLRRLNLISVETWLFVGRLKSGKFMRLTKNKWRERIIFVQVYSDNIHIFVNIDAPYGYHRFPYFTSITYIKINRCRDRVKMQMHPHAVCLSKITQSSEN